MSIDLALIDKCFCPSKTLIADRAHWYGVDRLCAYVCGETLISDRAHWFGISPLRACVHIDGIVLGFSIVS